MKKTTHLLLGLLSLFSFTLPGFANLEVVKGIKNNLTSVPAGQTFTYTLQYRAASTTTDFFGATLEDTLPAGIDFVSLLGTVHVQSFTYDAATRLVRVNFVDPLPAGSTGEIEVAVRFTPGSTPNGTVAVNTATMDATNAAPFTSNPVSITATATSQATLQKNLLGSGIPVDQNVTYQVVLNNNPANGNLNLSNISLVDTLPAGSVFVAASGAHTYDPVTHTVTWTAASLNAGSNLSRTVTLLFPSADFALGATIVNGVTAYYTPVGLPATSRSATTSHLIVAPVGASTFSKNVDGNYVYEGKEAFKTWNFTLRNDGNVPMENVVVTDPIPTALQVTSISTGNGAGTPAGLADPISVFYKTTLNPSWTPAPGNPYNGNSNTTIAVSSLGLAAGEMITELRWEFGTLPVSYQISNLRFVSTILTTDRNGDPVLTADQVNNTASLDYEDFTGPIAKTNPASITIRSPRPVARLEKSASPSTVNDGDTTTFTVRLINRPEAAQALIEPVLADLLDAKLVYVPGSWSVVQKPAGAPDPVFELIENFNGTGRTLLRWSWTGSSAYELPIDSRVVIQFQAQVPPATIFGNIRNDIHLVSWENDFLDTQGSSNRSDANDLNSNGNTSETIYFQGTNLTVRGRASMDSVKWVRGELDADWTKFPDSGNTVPGGLADYRLIIENTGNVPIRDAVILDILPTLDDTGVIDLSQRDTEWRASLAGPVTVPAGVTVYYSRSQNPERTAFVSSGPAGAEDPEWSTTPPATIIETRSLLFVFNDIVIQPGASYELSWPMRAPVATPTDGSIAWNSFGFYGTRVDTNGTLLASEPIKVGIKVLPDENSAYGDRVWLDLNLDGIQDPGEPGINGIRVHLYEDSGPGGFPDGVRDPAFDRYVGFTITSDDFNGNPGYYLFPNLDRGYYYAVFEIPAGYTVSPATQGSDPTVDSDVAAGDIFFDADDNRFGMTPIVWLPEETTDPTWDLGLWLPPADISIVKTAGTAADGEDFWTASGQTVTYTYVITNTGTVPLVRLRVDDDKLGAVARLDGPLAPGESVTVTKASGPLTAPVTNIGTVIAWPADPSGKEIPGALPVTADDPAVVRIYAALGNFIWHDVNRDGIQQGSENGVAGTIVTLYDENGDAIASQTTTANGLYLFNNLLPGNYSVGFEPPAGYVFTYQEMGGNPATDSDVDRSTGRTPLITLGEGQVDLTWDAGLFQYASLGDFTWFDENLNGMQDPDEVGLNGATVHLLDAAGNALLDADGDPITTVTDFHPTTGEPGYYIFTRLDPGTYRLRFEPPPGYLFTIPNADNEGIESGFNSNADPDTGLTDTVTLTSGEHNPRIDAGFIPGLHELVLTKTGFYRSGDCPDGNPLGLLGRFNALIFGNLEAHGGDTDARLAVAGNATIIGGYSVGTVVKGDPLPIHTGGTTDIFIVGGDLVDGNFGVNGNIVFGGTRTGPVRHMLNGNLIRQVNPVTFDANGNVPNDGSGVTFAQLLYLAQSYAALHGALEDRGVVVKDLTLGHTIELIGDDPVLNVFNVTAADWSVSSAGIHITAPASSTVLINIHGDTVEIHNSGTHLNGINERRILYNYVTATSLTTSNFAHLGSVLAPYADGHFTAGSIDGRAILGGNVFTTSGFEFHNFPLLGGVCLEVFYTFTVENVGNVTLTDITISDPWVDLIEGGPITLEAGEMDTTTFTALKRLSPLDLVNGEFINNASVTGTGPYGMETTAHAAHTLTFTIPGLGAGAPGAGGGAGAGGSGSPAVSTVLPDPDNAWQRPDFVVTNITLDPAPSLTGQTFAANVTVRNDGHIAGNAGVLRLWENSAGLPDPTATGTGEVNVGILAPGQSKTFSFGGLTAPAVAGTYFVHAYVDADGITAEYSLGNNTLPAAYTVFAPDSTDLPSWMKPDFIIQSIYIHPSPTVTSAAFHVRVRVSNIGDVPGTPDLVRIWFQSPSWNTLPAIADEEVTTLGSIAPGQTVELFFVDLRAPDDQGTYFVRAIVNPEETVDEKSFGNNHGGATYTVFPITLHLKPIPGVENILSWNSASGYLYTVERSTDMVDFTPIATDLPATPPMNSFIDTAPPAGPVFYRVWGFRP